MRVIAAAAVTAIAAADLADDLMRAGWEVSCDVWKGSKAFGKNWTLTTVDGRAVYTD